MQLPIDNDQVRALRLLMIITRPIQETPQLCLLDIELMQEFQNSGLLYFVYVSIGKSPQLVRLQLGTGSSDIWVESAQSTYCQGSDNPCNGGSCTFSQHHCTSNRSLLTIVLPYEQLIQGDLPPTKSSGPMSFPSAMPTARMPQATTLRIH